jgi:hypothetical protein
MFSNHSSDFLVVAAGFAFLLALPMFFRPLDWARVLGWRLPAQTDLAVYFGRCLGGVVCVLAAMGLVAAHEVLVQPFFFKLLLAAVGVNIVVHVWGAIKKIQPKSETIEIAVWVALFLGGLAFYPG